MAITVTELTSSYDNVDRTSYTTASITPAANSLLYVPYSTRHAATAPAATISGGGLTWTETEPEQVDGISAIGSWTAQCGASPGSFTITIAMDGGVTAIGASWHVLQVTGHQPGAAAAVVQSPIAATGLTGTTATVTFAALADPNNAQILHAMHRTSEAQAAEAGWTAGDLTRFGTTPTHSSAVTWKIGSADLSATQTFATSSRWQAQGIEVKIAVAVTVPGSIVHMGTSMTGTSSNTTLTTTYPTGYFPVDNDLAVLTVNQTGSNSAITTPAGYTLILRTQRTTTHVQAVYRRKLAAGDVAPTVVVAAASALNLDLSIWRNVDTTTAEDKAATSNTGTGVNGHTGPDIGTTVTSCSAIITAGYCDNMADGFGVSVTDDPAIDPFTAIDGISGEFAASAGPGGVAIAFHHNILPLQTDRTRVHSFVPTSGVAVSGGWIATTIALRAASPTVIPVPRGLHGAAIQQTHSSTGSACSPQDLYSTKLAVQAFNPFDGGGDVWSSGTDGNFWDVAQWSGPGRWTDLTSRTRGVEWTNGADQPAGRPRIATAVIELNNDDGLLSPWATSGAYTNGVESWFRSGALMRICFFGTDAALTVQYGRSIYTGQIEDIQEDSQGMSDAWLVVSLVEPLSRLARFNSIEQAEQGGGETIYLRLARLLDDAAWPFSFGLGSGTVPAHATAATFTGTTLAGERLAEVYLLGDSAGVYIYGHNNGSLLVNNPNNTGPSLTFSNKPTGGQLPIQSAQPYANNQRILNAAIGARVDGHEVEIDDGDSISKFGRIDTGNGWPRRDLICQSDVTIAAILNAVLDMRAQDDQGVGSIVVDCDQDPTSMFSHLAFLRLFENVNVRYVHPTTQSREFTQTSYVEAMNHKVTRLGYQMKWVATLSLAKYPA